MIDLIIVNLARLSVKQEWDGLLTAGGGSASPAMPKADMLAYYNTWDLTQMPPYGGYTSTNTGTSMNFAYQVFFPFYAPRDGSIDQLVIRQGSTTPASTEYLYVSIYDSDANNMPQTMLGYATYDLTVGGTQTNSSLSADPSLTGGNLYYVSWNRSATTSATFYTWAGIGAAWCPQISVSGDMNFLTDLSTKNSAPVDAPSPSTMRSYGTGSKLQIMARIPDA